MTASVSIPKIVVPPEFLIDEIRPNRGAAPADPSPPPLGVLEHFTGTFVGTGLNMIFRPNSGAPTTTLFPKPVTPAPPQPPSENVLEINLTAETLSFATQLGNVPNRGLEAQNDIFLNGIPYTQAINDVTNTETGRGDGKPVPIHFEPGLWMNIPPTKTNPVLAGSLARMASIPHGTTINAQGLAPNASGTAGPPHIPAVNITPFVINSSPPRFIPFQAQTVTNGDTPRIPQDLTKFIAAGTITDKIMADPNTVLRTALDGQTITNTITISVATNPVTPEFGGGTGNIAFLEGNAAITSPNAQAVSMQATFWIETVEHKITVPVFRPGEPPISVSAPAKPGHPAPVFTVQPPREIHVPTTITVTSTQIQYSQVVFLNFAGLTWPHVSVATLVPSTSQTVHPSVWGV